MSQHTDLGLSPIDRAALNQARELQRKKRVIKSAWLRMMAAGLAETKRRNELVDEVRAILNKEVKRDYEEAHPKKRTPR